MKRWLITALLCALVCCAAVKQYSIESPGASGMTSSYDIDVANPNTARLLINSDIVTTGGAVLRRQGIKTVGSNARKVYGAVGVFDPIHRWKHVIGASDTAINGQSLAGLFVSDSFGLSLSHGMGSERPVVASGYHDFLSWQGISLHADGRSIPVLSSVSSVKSKNSFSPQDSLFYDRHNINIEAPGQLRVTPLPNADAKVGCYEYRIRFRYNPASPITDGGYPGIASSIVCLQGQRAYLSLFDFNPVAADSLGDSITHVLIERRKVSTSDIVDSFYVVDTMSYDTTQSPYYVDSLSDVTVTSNGIVTLRWTSGLGAQPAPGSTVQDTLFAPNVLKYCGTPDSGFFADTTATTYQFRYSYYDPYTGVESPLGPLSVPDRLWYEDTFAVADSVYSVAPTRWAYVDQAKRGYFIRLYRTVVTPGVVGAGDSNVVGCVGTFNSNLARRIVGEFTTVFYYREVISSYVGDAELMAGFTQRQANDFHSVVQVPIYEHEIVVDEFGDPIIRPPLVGDIFAPFADIEYGNGRFWAIGDPLFPQRAYFSEIDAPNDWDVNNYLSVFEDENDQLVAVEKLGSDNVDVLYLFKHNGIYAATGTDPEYDLQLSTINNAVGAVSRGSVIKADNAIYFLTPTLKIYKLTNQSLDDIGYPVENWIDSIAGTYEKAVDSVRAFKLGKTVNWINVASREVLTYNYYAGSFSLTQFDTGYAPIGSFIYDTAQSRAGFGYESDWLFRSDSAKPFRTAYRAAIQVDSTASDRYSFPLVYQSPFLSDGSTQVQVRDIELDMSATSGSAVIVSIYDQRDSAVAVDTITTDGRASGKYRFGVKPHVGRQLSIRITTGATTFKLSKLWCDIREVGREVM